MKKMSFKFKLIMLCVFLCGVGALIGSISYIGTSDLIEIEKTITKDLIPRSELIGKLDSSYQKVRIEVRTLGLMNLPIAAKDQAITDTKAAVAQYEKYSDELKKRIVNPTEKEIFQKLEQEWLNFRAIGLRAIDLGNIYDEKAKEGLATIFAVDCPRAASTYQTSLNNYINFVEEEVHAASAGAESVANKVNITNLAVSVVGILLGLFAGIFLASRISAAIELISEKLTHAVRQLKESSEASTASSHSLSEASIEQAASVQETSASLEEISSMVEVTAKNASRSKDLVKTSLDEVSKGKNTIAQMIHSIDTIDKSTSEIMTQTDQNNERMNEIVGLISQIESKTKVINDIVFQTKLLSFNASVEAARAGESGKGFAVVAEEVGNLAAMSGKAAIEIGELISSSVDKVNHIATDSKNKISSLIDQAKQNVQKGGSVANECSHIFERIIQSVTSVSTSVTEISSATAEQSKGISEIKEAVRQIDDATQSNTIIANESAESAKELAHQSDSLSNVVQELIITIKGAAELVNNQSPSNILKLSHQQKKKGSSLPAKIEASNASHPDPEDIRFKEI